MICGYLGGNLGIVDWGVVVFCGWGGFFIVFWLFVRCWFYKKSLFFLMYGRGEDGVFECVEL